MSGKNQNNSANPAPGNDFASQWDFSPLRYRFGIAATNTVNAAMLAGVALYTATQGANIRVALCVAAALAFQAAFPLLARLGTKALFIQNSQPADPALNRHIQSYIRRAGISTDIPVRVMKFDKARQQKSFRQKRFQVRMNYGAAIMPAAYSAYGKDTLILGHETLKLLNRDQLTAVVCHEISHIKNKSPKGNLPVNTGLSTAFLLAATGAVTSPELSALALGAWGGGKVLKGIAGQFDEFRADYNSAGQYPHPTALGASLNKLRETVSGILYPNKRSWRYLSAYANQKAFGEHPSVPRRIAAHQQRLPAVADFYQKTGLPRPC